jgi:tetratricopeptide (TPR) repeat protein
MQKKEDRRALLGLALGDDPVYHQIDFDGAAEPFTVNMLELLAQRGELVLGKQALWALLEVAGERVGVEQAARIQTLQPAIAALSQRPRVLRRERLPVIARALFGSAKPLPLALLGVLFVALALMVVRGSPLVTEAYAQKAPYCLPDHICVLVVRFVRGNAGADPTPEAFSDRIYDETDKLLAATTHERFTLKRLVLAEEKDGETRRRQLDKLAREHGAALAVGISIPENQQGEPVADLFFSLADWMAVGEASAAQPYRAEPLGYDELDQPCNDCMLVPTSRDAQIVAYAASGLYHYVRYRSRAARHAFEAALYCAGELEKSALDEAPPTCPPDPSGAARNPGLLYYYRGKAFFLEGDYGEAIRNLNTAADKNPGDPAAWIGMVAAYQGWLGTGHENDPLISQAVAEATKRAEALLSKRAKDTAAARYDLGFVYELAGKTDQAQRYYAMAEKELSEQGQNPYTALVALARVQLKEKNRDPEAARAFLMRAQEVEPNLPWAYIALAQLHEDDRPAAEEWLRKAQGRADRHDASVDLATATLCQAWGDRTCAAEAFQRALNKRPESGNLHSLAGDFYREAGDWPNALTYYEEAGWLRPKDPWEHERFAYVLFQKGDFAGASAHYEEAIKLAYRPEVVPDGIYCGLGSAQKELGKTASAVESYRECLSRTTDPVRREAAEREIEKLEQRR